MKLILGLILVILFVFLALYVGVWLCFILGIREMILAIMATPIDALHFAIGLAKFFAAGVLGWATFLIALVPGMTLIIAWLDKR